MLVPCRLVPVDLVLDVARHKEIRERRRREAMILGFILEREESKKKKLYDERKKLQWFEMSRCILIRFWNGNGQICER